jgi:hypothetical protein
MTVGRLLDQFVSIAQIAPATRQDWQRLIRQHLVPALDEIPPVEPDRTRPRPVGYRKNRATARWSSSRVTTRSMCGWGEIFLAQFGSVEYADWGCYGR